MADDVSGIWLAWAAMARRLTGSTARTSTVQSTSTVDRPSGAAARPRPGFVRSGWAAMVASTTRWVSTKWRYSRSTVDSYRVGTAASVAAASATRWTWMWSTWP